jgi:hypothetical protein
MPPDPGGPRTLGRGSYVRLGNALGALAVGSALLWPATAGAVKKEYVAGGFAQAAQCIPSGGAPTATATTWEFECAAGTTTWTGDLRGQTLLSEVRGTVDLLTFSTVGTAKETIHLATPDGRMGTLDMVSSFVSEGNEFEATNTVVGGSGNFAGARGEIWFEGAVFGTGTYSGWIKTKPKRTRSRRAHR